MLLEAGFRARLERMALTSHGRVRGVWSGGHASLQRGESLDFADYREYTPGDDFRRIDHALWARLGVVLVRLFEAEDELPVRLVLDRSQSMDFGDKLGVARRLAGMIGFLGLAAGDRVVPFRTPGAGDTPFDTRPAMRHLSSWPALEGWLEATSPIGQAELAATSHYLAGHGTTRGPAVVISDFLGEGLLDSLDTFGFAGGGVVLHVLAPDELDPVISGDLRLVDAETGREVNVSTTPETMKQYRSAVDDFVATVASRARRNGMDHLLVPAVPDAHELALAALSRSQLVR